MDVQKECPCSQRHHTRRLDEAATESGVQSVFFSQSHLCRNFRKLCLQVVFARQNGLSGANRAAVAAACPGRDIGSAAVSVWTYPPDAARGPRQHLLRCQRRVLFIIPFLRNLRKPVCQSVFSDDRNMVCTDRAAGSLRSAMDGRLPLVALRAFPPDLSMGMRCDVCGR